MVELDMAPQAIEIPQNRLGNGAAGSQPIRRTPYDGAERPQSETAPPSGNSQSGLARSREYNHRANLIQINPNKTEQRSFYFLGFIQFAIDTELLARLVRRQFRARKMSEALVPPKPNELDKAAWIGRLRAL